MTQTLYVFSKTIAYAWGAASAYPAILFIDAELTDMQGKQVYVKNFGVLRAGQFTHEIPTTSLVKGLYVLRVMMGGKVNSFKIIID